RGLLPPRHIQVSRLRPECVLIKTEVLERVGELDQGLPEILALEDLCLRATEAGYRAVIAEDSSAEIASLPASRPDDPAEQAFAARWGVTRAQYFLRGHRPLRRISDE